MLMGGAPAPAAGIADDFNRANEALTDSSNWYQITNGGDVVSNVAQGEAGAGSYLRWATQIGSTDGYVEIDVLDQGIGLTLRSDSGRTVWYEAYYATDGNIYLSRNGATVLDGPTAGSTLPVRLRLECNGTTIRVLEDDVEVLSATDSNIDGSSGNFPGIYLHSGNPEADNFEAGGL